MEKKLDIQAQSYNKIILVLQTLVHEEVITKNTYDNLHKELKNYDNNTPSFHDFAQELFKDLKPGSPGLVSLVSPKEFLQGIIAINGNIYNVTLQRS
jgi:hypothetical protein